MECEKYNDFLAPPIYSDARLKAGAPLDVARRIAKIVEGDILKSNVTEVSTKEIMKEVLTLLKKENEEWYRNWIIFDKAVKRRSTEKEISK